MDETIERRMEQRLRYHWPVWFAEDFDAELSQGQMADLSSSTVALTCYADDSCPHPEQRITARFSVPRFGPDDSFDMVNFTRNGRVFRVDHVNKFLCRVAIQFTKALPFKPGEQANSESDTQQSPELVTV